MTELIRDLGEKGLLDRLRKFIRESGAIVRAFSEDCAVIDSPGRDYLLLTMDVLVEGQHFRRDWMPPHYIGRKAVKVNLSDISAMGGRPLYYMVSLGVPPQTQASFVDEIYEGMETVSRETGLMLIGGNVSASPVLFVDISMIGEVGKDLVLMRKGAQRGDAIFVSGVLGVAAMGLRSLEHGYRPGKGPIPPEVLAQWDPPNLNELAQKLAGSGLVTSMMDLSDGLASDLPELCRESDVGALIEMQKIPTVSTELALTGGEDYHLLFTVAANRLDEFEDFRFPVYRIGRIVGADLGIFMIDGAGRRMNLDSGFEHFS